MWRRNGVYFGPHETVLLKNRYIHLHSIDIYNIQMNVLENIKSHGSSEMVFLDELCVSPDGIWVEIFDNNNCIFMTALSYIYTQYIYIVLKSILLKEYICAWIGDVKEMYNGYCISCCLSMGRFSIYEGDNRDVTLSYWFNRFSYTYLIPISFM